jgi:DNA-binding PadR family transcriptional regulator
MDESNAGPLRDSLDYFILKRFGDDGPLSTLEIQRRAKPIHALLEMFASRRGKQSLGSLPTVLQRLQSEGWLKADPQSDERPESGLVYSLTASGEQRLKDYWARHESMLAQFGEDAEMDRSFRQFLDSRRPPDGN